MQSHPFITRRPAVLDLVFVLVTVGFFVVAIAYARACERL
jgi:hypothetical protein